MQFFHHFFPSQLPYLEHEPVELEIYPPIHLKNGRKKTRAVPDFFLHTERGLLIETTDQIEGKEAQSGILQASHIPFAVIYRPQFDAAFDVVRSVHGLSPDTPITYLLSLDPRRTKQIMRQPATRGYQETVAEGLFGNLAPAFIGLL